MTYDQEIERRAHPENFCNHANQVNIEDADEWGYDKEDLLADGYKPHHKICIECGSLFKKPL